PEPQHVEVLLVERRPQLLEVGGGLHVGEEVPFEQLRPLGHEVADRAVRGSLLRREDEERRRDRPHHFPPYSTQRVRTFLPVFRSHAAGFPASKTWDSRWSPP